LLIALLVLSACGEDDEANPAAADPGPPAKTQEDRTTAEPETEPEKEEAAQDDSQAVSASDRRAVQRLLRRAFSAYNSGDFVRASSYVSRKAERACGGPTAHAFAYSQARENDSTTRREIRVTNVEREGDDGLLAEYTYTEDADDGSAPTQGNTDDDTYVREDGELKFADDFTVISPWCE
jgi:hypothetical protein